jgi:hypothetical protein
MNRGAISLSDPNSNYHKSDKIIFIAIASCLGIYLVIRAILVPMAHDEIATFYYFVQSGKVSPFLTNIDTNNHFLNSALTWVFYHLFGPTPLALRLSNLVFIPVFFYFLYKISLYLKSRVLRFSFFLTLAFTLHFIEFLALSRGYGISMAMLMACLFYLIEGISKQKKQYFVISMLAIFTACTANLALINTYALVLLFASITLIINNLKQVKSVLPTLFIAGFIPIIIVITQILYIKVNSGLIAGSPDNFWATTIISLFAYLFEISKFSASLIAAALFCFIAVIGFAVIYRLKRFKIMLNSIPLILLYLLAGNIFSILILGVIFKVNYPDDRIGLYLYPLAVCSLFFLFDQLIINNKAVKILAVVLLIIPVHFFYHLNTTYSIWYKYDVIPKRFYQKVMQNYRPGEMPPTIAGHGMRIFCWSYLGYINGGIASQFYFTHFPDYNADFQIVNLKMIPGWQQFYDTIDYDPVSERHLLKLRKPYQSFTLITEKINANQKNTSAFFNIAEGKADTLINKNLQVEISFALSSEKKPFNGRIVFDIWDKQNQSLRYEYIQFNWLRNSWDGKPDNFNNCMLVYKVPPEASKYKIYIWNIDKAEFANSEGYIRIKEIR